MLWIVTQTETTLNTGDHSLPRMEAHICMETGARQGVLLGCGQPSNKARTYMAI